jgi:hypothetical protein
MRAADAFEMALLRNLRVGKHPSASWRGVLVVLGICVLTVNVVTRYSILGSEARGVKTVISGKSHSGESQRQRLLGNGLHWAAPAPKSTLVQPPRAAVHAVSAVFLAINLDSESWLYNRPPPSC